MNQPHNGHLIHAMDYIYKLANTCIQVMLSMNMTDDPSCADISWQGIYPVLMMAVFSSFVSTANYVLECMNNKKYSQAH